MRCDATDIDALNESAEQTHELQTDLLTQIVDFVGKDFKDVTLQDAVEAAGRLGGLFEQTSKLVAELMWRGCMENELAAKGDDATVENALESLNKVRTRRSLAADRVPMQMAMGGGGLHSLTLFACYQHTVLAHLGNILTSCNEALVIFGEMVPTAEKHGIDLEALRGGDVAAIAAYKRACLLDNGYTFDEAGRVVGMPAAQAAALGLEVAPANENEPDAPDDVRAALGG